MSSWSLGIVSLLRFPGWLQDHDLLEAPLDGPSNIWLLLIWVYTVHTYLKVFLPFSMAKYLNTFYFLLGPKFSEVKILGKSPFILAMYSAWFRANLCLSDERGHTRLEEWKEQQLYCEVGRHLLVGDQWWYERWHRIEVKSRNGRDLASNSHHQVNRGKFLNLPVSLFTCLQMRITWASHSIVLLWELNERMQIKH